MAPGKRNPAAGARVRRVTAVRRPDNRFAKVLPAVIHGCQRVVSIVCLPFVELVRGSVFKRHPAAGARVRRVTAAAQPDNRIAKALSVVIHGCLRIISIICLPFVVLVRGSVLLYDLLHLPGWIALGLAAAVVIGILTLYGAWISRRLSGKPRVGMIAKWVALPVVIGYSGYAMLFLARSNAKDERVRSAYTATHPLLRVALSTVILVNPDLVITDLARTPEDYRRMGLSVREASLHYPQAGGWVHAVDLRTTGQGFVTNALIWIYFRAMGFETLRHRGTADHLHVALEPR